MSLFGAVWRGDPHDDDLKYLKRGENPCSSTDFSRIVPGLPLFPGPEDSNDRVGHLLSGGSYLMIRTTKK